MKLTYYGLSNIGKFRANNEDAYLIDPSNGIFAVADGMGGHNAGEVASWMAIEIFSHLNSSEAYKDLKPSKRFVRIFEFIHRLINSVSSKSPMLYQMGTTLTVLLLKRGKYYIGHIGDSRVYLIRKGKLKQLTKDDTLVQSRVDQGLITPEEARHSNDAHILIKALGVGELPKFQFLKGRAKKKDIFLLTSDGLTDELSDDEIIEIIGLSPDLKSSVENLIRSVMEKEAKDNITVIMVEVGDKWPVVPPPKGMTPERLPAIKRRRGIRKFLPFKI